MALNKGDLTQIKVVLQQELNKQEKRLGRNLDEKLDGQEEKFEIKLTEFKSEFFEKVDPILKEVTTAREESPLIESRIETLEKIHQSGKHSLPPQ